MRIGIDAFTIRELNLNPFEQADFVKKRGFEGIMYAGVRQLSETLDAGELRAIHEYTNDNGLYSYVSVSCVNPTLADLSFEEQKARLEEEIAAAAKAGWHELHSIMCRNQDDRYTHPIPWDKHIQNTIMMMNQLRPTLERYGSRINIEDHSDATFDVLKVIEATGSHMTGVCLDTANTLVNGEDPIEAAKRVAPYTHLTHTKDAIMTFCDTGILRQGKTPGMGCIDFERMLPILGKYSPDLPLSIEDHKWLFRFDIFDPEWHAHNPDLTTAELGKYVGLAWRCQQKLDSGEWPPIEEYEAIPYLDQMEERLAFGRDYLRALLKKLGLD